jgi:hypothetical protein
MRVTLSYLIIIMMTLLMLYRVFCVIRQMGGHGKCFCLKKNTKRGLVITYQPNPVVTAPLVTSSAFSFGTVHIGYL